MGITSHQPMLGTRSPARPGSSRDDPPGMRPSPSWRPNSSLSSASSCMPRQMPSTGAPSAARRPDRLDQAALVEDRHGTREGAHTRKQQGIGATHCVAFRYHPRRQADAPQCRLHGAQIGHAAIDNGYHGRLASPHGQSAQHVVPSGPALPYRLMSDPCLRCSNRLA